MNQQIVNLSATLVSLHNAEAAVTSVKPIRDSVVLKSDIVYLGKLLVRLKEQLLTDVVALMQAEIESLAEKHNIPLAALEAALAKGEDPSSVFTWKD